MMQFREAAISCLRSDDTTSHLSISRTSISLSLSGLQGLPSRIYCEHARAPIVRVRNFASRQSMSVSPPVCGILTQL